MFMQQLEMQSQACANLNLALVYGVPYSEGCRVTYSRPAIVTSLTGTVVGISGMSE